jgi:hypothetical protein
MAHTGAKRLKLQHEAERASEIVIDPIEVIREPLLQDLIFQHLSASDVKNLFTVSQTWNQAASESRKAMSKIKLDLNENRAECRSIPLKDIRILLNSNRRYQNARFWFIRETNINRKILLLERFSLSLVDLQYFCDTKTAKYATSELHFPKLEKLLFFLATNSEQQFIRVLQGATVLKEVYLNYCSSMPVLMSVSSSLSSLKITMCYKEMFGYILTSFPNLRKFSVYGFLFSGISKFNNQSITELTLPGRYLPLPNNVISSMKNLEFVNYRACIESDLRKILTEGKRLKRVNIKKWNQRENLTPIEIYETLMASDRTIPRNIEIVVTDD